MAEPYSEMGIIAKIAVDEADRNMGLTTEELFPIGAGIIAVARCLLYLGEQLEEQGRRAAAAVTAEELLIDPPYAGGLYEE
jgi:hypothetical protein